VLINIFRCSHVHNGSTLQLRSILCEKGTLESEYDDDFGGGLEQRVWDGDGDDYGNGYGFTY
jgi:hypothetical protein